LAGQTLALLANIRRQRRGRDAPQACRRPWPDRAGPHRRRCCDRSDTSNRRVIEIYTKSSAFLDNPLLA